MYLLINFWHEWRKYNLYTAWFNIRWAWAYNLASAIVRRPLYMTWHQEKVDSES